jgi:hypothetical protein
MKTKNAWLIGAAIVVIAALFTGCSNPEAEIEYITDYVNMNLDHITVSQGPNENRLRPVRTLYQRGTDGNRLFRR